ncbi:hypothetical protein ACET3X_007564 [Alternaria dauci]|uniref:Uncharacterized protein n=1 Tax=Alternaria dauci TaxID=48095 RepID=A0ABR3UDT0_9PLEO
MPSIEVELPRKELELEVELVMVFDTNSAEEEDVEFLLVGEEGSVPGNGANDLVEVQQTGILVKGLLKESDGDAELDVKTELSEEPDVTESDRVEPVGSVVEMLFALLVSVGSELAGSELPDVMPGVASNELRLLDNASEELPVLLARLALGLNKFKLLEDVPADEDNPEESLDKDSVKPSLRVEGNAEELKVVVTLEGSEVNPMDEPNVGVVETLKVNDELSSDVGCEGMSPDVPEGGAILLSHSVVPLMTEK